MYNNTKEISITILDLVKTVWNPTVALDATDPDDDDAAPE
jgi:hypothetical protein